MHRRLRFFEIYKTDKEITVDQVKTAVLEQMSWTGELLGYQAMQLELRQCHKLNVPRDLVYAVMTDIDPDIKQKKRKKNFISAGPNWVVSIDGHDKLMGYQNSTFP